MLADATRFAGRLAHAGAALELHVFADMQHIWPIVSPDLAESKAGIDAIARFCDQDLAV